jgi:hypothetical protein
MVAGLFIISGRYWDTRLLLNSNENNGTPGNVVAFDIWNNTAATSSVVTVGSYNGVNESILKSMSPTASPQ